MTDAERIAEYLKRCNLDDGDPSEYDRIIRYTGTDFTDESRYGVVKHLMAMLSDVRREEREAIRAIVRERTNIAASNGLSTMQLNMVCAAIDAMGL